MFQEVLKIKNQKQRKLMKKSWINQKMLKNNFYNKIKFQTKKKLIS